jgi:splicing factor U2AF 35 kDa subunit
VNCPFYFKIGACRHGDRCSRQHNKPIISQTLLIPHMYVAPELAAYATGKSLSKDETQNHFEDFFAVGLAAVCSRRRRCTRS